MKNLYIFIGIFTIINISIIYYLQSLNICLSSDNKTYLILFYVACGIFLAYTYSGSFVDTFIQPPSNTDSESKLITLDVSNMNAKQVIYWIIASNNSTYNNFNNNGIIDVTDNTVNINVNTSMYMIKYRIIDVNGKLSDIFEQKINT